VESGAELCAIEAEQIYDCK